MEDWITLSYLYENIKHFLNENYNFMFTDIKAFCAQKGWFLIPYNNQDNELNQISEDGFTFLDNNDFHIFYNTDKPKTRQRFTISHEIGHIMLYHHIFVSTNLLMLKQEYKPIWEKHADIFAQNILMPPDFAINLKKSGYSNSSISKFLGLSIDMVNVRYASIDNDIKQFKKIHF